MSTDVARLNIIVDSKGAPKTDKELNKLTKTVEKLTKELEQLKKQKEKSKEKLSLIDRIKQLFTGG